MKIAPARHPDRAPRTRRELLSHLWGVGLDCNIFKEGPFYAVRANRVISATGIRTINHFSFADWEQCVRNVAALRSV